MTQELSQKSISYLVYLLVERADQLKDEAAKVQAVNEICNGMPLKVARHHLKNLKELHRNTACFKELYILSRDEPCEKSELEVLDASIELVRSELADFKQLLENDESKAESD